jgi:putative ATP-dependent endonuclease of the OLD family
MKIKSITIHNFRSIVHAEYWMYDYTLLVGVNNSGKSTIINALRVFYDDVKWNADDWPRIGADGDEAWIEVIFSLTETEVKNLPEKYQCPDQCLRVRKYLKSPTYVKANQSNIYAYLPDGNLEATLFFGAKNISQAKLGSIVYIPALSVPSDHLKTSGPSPLRSILSFILKRMVAGSPAYARLQAAFAELNAEALGSEGLLAELAAPMNRARVLGQHR